MYTRLSRGLGNETPGAHAGSVSYNRQYIMERRPTAHAAGSPCESRFVRKLTPASRRESSIYAGFFRPRRAVASPSLTPHKIMSSYESAAAAEVGLLLVGHGTREPAGVNEFLTVAKLVAERFPQGPVESSFLELATPTIGEGVARLAQQGVRRVVVAPVILFAAGHIRRDIPAAVRRPSRATRSCKSFRRSTWVVIQRSSGFRNSAMTRRWPGKVRLHPRELGWCWWGAAATMRWPARR